MKFYLAKKQLWANQNSFKHSSLVLTSASTVLLFENKTNLFFTALFNVVDLKRFLFSDVDRESWLINIHYKIGTREKVWIIEVQIIEVRIIEVWIIEVQLYFFTIISNSFSTTLHELEVIKKSKSKVLEYLKTTKGVFVFTLQLYDFGCSTASLWWILWREMMELITSEPLLKKLLWLQDCTSQR